jgi:intracellular septation protein
MTDAPATTPAAAERPSPLVKLAIDLGPLATFLVVNARTNIFYGTGAFMVATVIAIVAARLVLGKIPVMLIISGVFVMIFGGLTIYLQDQQFIKLKFTVVNALFGVGLLAGLMRGVSLLRYLFGDVFSLTEEGWRQLTWRWSGFFLALAALNEIAWRLLTHLYPEPAATNYWISLKLFVVIPLTMAFGLAQLGLLKRHELTSG